ncbi:alpha/beta-hydrolase [Daldinia caldariorum]|uniref:alpha/beta-hydrolase n=1 Tax=Daldinia caldariorum TaxID=326644 RepID=UPI0020082722|nr:alpha/beta-hydrolase [Daldinia caldariorum]KAI1469729.1 alpha/beta-hydrolase [Daldinia caldariorum]
MKPFSYALVPAFALLAAAGPVPATHYEISSGNTVTNADVSILKFFSQYAGASYCNSEVDLGSIVTCAENTCPDVTAAGAKVVATFSGHLTDIQGFVATDDKNELIVVSIRGTHSIRNWIADLSFVPLPCHLVDGCLMHTGFHVSWKEIEDKLLKGVAAAKKANPSYEIIFTGHSLGGAVATVAAGYAREKGYKLDLYTYGSPRVGNKALVDFITAQPGGEYRVTHSDDPVPRLPPIFADYRHTSPEYWLSTGSNDTVTTYAAADVKVCSGFANTHCNGGTGGLDVDAHLSYFGHISGCGPDGLPFKERRTRQREVTDDAELLQRLEEWAALDRQISSTLENDSPSA